MHEMDRLLEASRLFDERSHEILREHLRYAGDVEDVLLGIQSRELPAGVRKRVDDLRRHTAHARIKKREETSRSSADNRNVLDLLNHLVRFAARSPRYKPLASLAAGPI